MGGTTSPLQKIKYGWFRFQDGKFVEVRPWPTFSILNISKAEVGAGRTVRLPRKFLRVGAYRERTLVIVYLLVAFYAACFSASCTS